MRSLTLRQLLLAGVVCATIAIAAFGQQNPPAQPTSAGPYLNNAAAGTTTLPLAAPSRRRGPTALRAVKDTLESSAHSIHVLCIHCGQKEMIGTVLLCGSRRSLRERSVLRTLYASQPSMPAVTTDPATYCAMANAGYDFIWTEMQHDQRD